MAKYAKYNFFRPFRAGFSKRIEVGVSIYKVGGELSAGGTNRVPQAQVSIFYKKNAFQSTKNFRRIQWQNMLRMHLL
jgi:hypothetical protein